MPPVIDENKCIKCGMCAKYCPEDVFFGTKAKECPTVAYPEECSHCNSCVEECPEGAVSLRIPSR
jgi:adenylylsulfate reductase subunit B